MRGFVAQAVAVQGTHPAYRLKQADLTVIGD